MAGSWQVSQITAGRWVADAVRLTTALPRTLALLETGELFEHQAKVLLHRTRNCTEEVARAVEQAVLPAGAALYPSDLAERVDRAVLRIESEQEGAAAAEQRRADLFAALPAMVLAGTAQDRCHDEAGQPRRPWTLGPEQLAAQVVLHVHVPVSTVLDLSREPGSLGRYGPISAQHVRLLRPASLRRVLVDVVDGRPIAVDDRARRADQDPEHLREQVQALLGPAVVTDVEEPQHDPSARLARLVDVRDVHCCGPGCSSSRTERDHLLPYPAGPTSAANLALESPRCHHAKHSGWTLERHLDGSTTWRSPLRRTYWRPSPHEPPPQVDLWQEPPPLRPRPGPRAPAADDQLASAAAERRQPTVADERHAGDDQACPF